MLGKKKATFTTPAAYIDISHGKEVRYVSTCCVSWTFRRDVTRFLSHAQEMLRVMLVCEAGQSHHRSCFLSLLLHPLKVTSSLTLLTSHGVQWRISRTSTPSTSTAFQILLLSTTTRDWALQCRTEVKGQREAIVMEVQGLLPGNESDVCVLSNKNRVHTWIQYKIYFMQCFYLQCHSHRVLIILHKSACIYLSPNNSKSTYIFSFLFVCFSVRDAHILTWYII